MLSRREHAVLDTLLPSGASEELPWGVKDLDFDAFYREFERTALFPMRAGFRLALFFAIWIAPLLALRIPPITLYRRETREAILMGLYNSRYNLLRQMIFLLKATVCFAYGADPRVRNAVGYPVQHDAGEPAPRPEVTV